jgi:hypothetical protein
MRFVLAMVLGGLVGFPLSVSAQPAEEDSLSSWQVAEGASLEQPAPEEPALELKLDDTGVEVTPTSPRTFNGYTLEELELRKRRAAFGLIAPAALIVAGVPPLVVGMRGAACDDNPGFEFDSDHCRRLRTAGLTLTISGNVGMIVALPLAGGRVGALRSAKRDYALEELELRVKRAKIGLGVSGGVVLAGFVTGAIYLAKAEPFDFCIFDCPPPPPEWVDRVGWASIALLSAGFVGLITASGISGHRKRELRRLQGVHYETPRRVQWDIAQSRLVF